MRILVIQCHEGTGIGEISREHIEDSEYFYYHYNNPIKIIEYLENKKIPQANKALIIQYNSSNKTQRILIGTYHKLKDDNKVLIKNILKIDELLEFEEANFDKIKKIINFNSKDKASHTLEYKTLSDSDYEELLLGLKDKVYVWKSRNKDNKNIDKDIIDNEILDSYKRLEGNLCVLAQKSAYARRVISTQGQRMNRTEYQRDWERIIHSKAFRRLEDKAQIYTLAKGDHFRTRLTHTLEVTQIARGIARELKLNEDLVEAIALGHDLGHTPFGHIGERTLHELLQTDEVLRKAGGFKHNYQSVRVVNYLEEKYGDFQGLNLTYQVMEGMLKHTKIKKCKDSEGCNDCSEKCYKIQEFLCLGEADHLYMDYNFSVSLEGQVVAYSDEIAQRAHDLDDGINSGMIKVEEFLKELEKDDDFSELVEKLNESLIYINENKRYYIDNVSIKGARIVSDVITFFINKLVENSLVEMEKYKTENNINDDSIKDCSELVIKRPVIGFDKKTENVRKKLEKLTSNKVINSEEVNCFDGKGAYVIKKLFRAYHTNPRQLPTSTIRRIHRELTKYSNNVVNIRDGESELIQQEIEIYKGINVDNELKRLKHKIFIRSIIDLIAGMTDDYANKQFDKLYSPGKY